LAFNLLTIVYKTFPFPPGGTEKMDRLPIIRNLVLGIFAARAAHLGATLADLDDRDTMPAASRKTARNPKIPRVRYSGASPFCQQAVGQAGRGPRLKAGAAGASARHRRLASVASPAAQK
jgi:hypothetical protein